VLGTKSQPLPCRAVGPGQSPGPTTARLGVGCARAWLPFLGTLSRSRQIKGKKEKGGLQQLLPPSPRHFFSLFKSKILVFFFVFPSFVLASGKPNTKKPRKGKTGKNKKIYSQKTNKLHFYFITFWFFFHFFFLSPSPCRDLGQVPSAGWTLDKVRPGAGVVQSTRGRGCAKH
jgi:hypothetical protein